MRKWTPLIAIAIGAFMLLVDITIVVIALPDMAVDLGTSFSSLQWVIDIYALVLAGLLLGAGALGDRIGRRLIYVGGLVVFALSSLAAGLAPGAAELIVARGFQGAGGAAMLASTVALINDSYQGRDRGIAFGVWGAVNGAAAAAGPIVGGVLTQGLSWRWIFFVNIPIGLVAIAMALRGLPRDGNRSKVPIDVPGIAAFTIAAAALTYALTRVPAVGWTGTSTVLILALACAAAAAFLVIESRSPNPAIEIALLRRPAFAGVLFAAIVLSVSAFSCGTYLSLWLQTVRDLTPIGTGLALIPLSLAALVSALALGRFLHRAPPALPIAIGLALVGTGTLLQARLDAGSTWSALTVGLVVVGLGAGFATPGLASAALASVPAQRAGMASGALNTMRQLGYALGIAMLGVICQARIADVLRERGIGDPDHVAHDVIAGQAGAVVGAAPAAERGAVDDAIHAAFASGLNRALVVAGALGIVGAVVVAVTGRMRTAPEHGFEASADPAAAA